MDGKCLNLRRAYFAVFLLMAIAVLWNVQFPQFIFVNFSRSAPRGLYLRSPQGEIHVGDGVVYLPTEKAADVMRGCGWLSEGESPRPFLKFVGALSGDWYSVSSKSFFVNGDYIGEAVSEDSEGHPLPLMLGTHVVPEGEFLPITRSPRSFDGRYTGTVPLGRIVAKVIPILVVD